MISRRARAAILGSPVPDEVVDTTLSALNERLAALDRTPTQRRQIRLGRRLLEIFAGGPVLRGVADEAVTWRLSQAAEARNRAMRSQQEDKAEYDLGENGARINRGEREALNALLENISFSKPRR